MKSFDQLYVFQDYFSVQYGSKERIFFVYVKNISKCALDKIKQKGLSCSTTDIIIFAVVPAFESRTSATI